ncbi:glutamate--tRNA ligase [Candidatus Woesearchaeota archaeon]|nr:glutamate--tRNA ligase [Candidatus Woesearchaeota archaeon]
MNKFAKEIEAYVLKSYLEFGDAHSGKILAKLFQHGLDKKNIKDIMPEIEKKIKEISKLSKKEQEQQFEILKDLVKEQEEKEKTLPEIDVSSLKKVVTRLAPEPSKYNHLGHAMSFLLNYIYTKKYKGKCLLRFEDTNPEKVSQEYVDAMLQDVINYLDIKVDSIKYVSDDMSLFYNYAEELIKKDKAYICFCNRDKVQELRHKGKECECRNKDIKNNLEEWKKLLDGEYKEGTATLRIKGDMKNKNHVMRDSVIFRIINKKHYRHGTKYKVWPMYDFYNAIEDSIMGVTLILRSNEFDLRSELQDHIKDLLGLEKQLIVQYGRFNVLDFTTKGREIRDLVESKTLIGWDDPRLITLRALKRRGITKETIYELINQIGLVKHPVNLDFNMIASINRKIIDPKVDRYSFIQDQIELEIKNQPKIKEINYPIHPDKKETRKVKVENLFISSEDFKNLKGKEIRLLHLFNINLDKKSEFTSLEIKNIPKINWVSKGLKTKILMPDGKWVEGISEESIKNLKIDDLIQFERFGFVRLDRINKSVYEFWFTHK